MTLKNVTVKPFIKWAGGKGQLISEISNKYPDNLGYDVDKYCEPFVGGGAVLFDVLSKYNLKQVIINDINKELINTYRQIRDNAKTLIIELNAIQEIYHSFDISERKKMYYEMRDRYNHLKINGNESVNIEKAKLFIFLNKTCFNGLYRVNKKGLFNVPIGGYKKPLICDEENLLNASKLLQNAEILCGDYSDCINYIDENTFVYIDPPYRPLNNTSSFTSYDEKIFDDDEQVRLRDFINEISMREAKVLLSNSDPKNVDTNDDFFDVLYSEYRIDRILAKRMINSVAEKRGSVSELLISN
ncbi:MAG: DNA adenine methylase [Clostridia bacterium]|nr:DNA adenine methylase [Clostridia bacterium]